MSFISFEYCILLCAAFTFIHSTTSPRFHTLVILCVSYVFYAWWDWRFLALLIGLSLLNWGAGLLITQDRARAKLVLIGALIGSFAILAIFKYANFFLGNLSDASEFLGGTRPFSTLDIILPLGISFITFQATAYTIDVYRGDHAAEADPIKFLAFVAFFPQLVAGPIERAKDLLDQFGGLRRLDSTMVRRAVLYLVYGYTLKMVLADSFAPVVDSLFVKDQHSAWSVVLATLGFGLQIYCDFWGYSLIAKGSALLLGYELRFNFLTPYWSTSIIEFWRRWHVSLSDWLRDYLYIPLGGSRFGAFLTYRNLIITMTLGGLWHGASWNFVFWGLLHGLALAAWRVSGAPAVAQSRLGAAFGWFVTMLVVFAGWFLFRATDWQVLSAMMFALGNWEWLPVHGILLRMIAVAVLALAAFEYMQQRYGGLDGLALAVSPAAYLVRPVAFGIMIVMCIAMTRTVNPTFIYFQF
jgi:alginate O-acetyltransferase complex protein AlgI